MIFQRGDPLEEKNRGDKTIDPIPQPFKVIQGLKLEGLLCPPQPPFLLSKHICHDIAPAPDSRDAKFASLELLHALNLRRRFSGPGGNCPMERRGDVFTDELEGLVAVPESGDPAFGEPDGNGDFAGFYRFDHVPGTRGEWHELDIEFVGAEEALGDGEV